MAEEVQHQPATLVEVELGDGETPAQPKSGGRVVPVQFNPESLKLTRANTVAKTDTAGSAAMQFVATTSSKLDLELWFDVTVFPGERKLRDLTGGIYYFITPDRASSDATFKVPGVRFHWGEFLFDGVLTTLNETLELFSSDGRPLRSRMSLGFTSQDIRFRVEGMSGGGGTGAPGPGQTPQTPVKAGDSVQQLAAQAGRPDAWKAVAAANQIENPRLPQVGALLVPARVSLSATTRIGGISVSGSARLGGR